MLGVLMGFVFAIIASAALAQTEASVAVSGPFKVSAQAPVGTQVAGVRFYVDGAAFGYEDRYAPFEATLSTVSVANGSHSIVAVIRNVSGQYATSSPLVVTTYNKKTLSPSLSSALFYRFEGTAIASMGANIVAKASGTAVGSATYSFYCNSTDTSVNTRLTPDGKYTDVNTTTQSHSCIYPSAGVYYPKVVIERDGAVSQARRYVSLLPPKIPSSKFSIGNRVKTTYSVNVRSEPSLASALVGVQLSGIVGTVLEGPVYFSGYWWWKIDYDTGADGWSTEGYLTKVTTQTTTTTTPVPAGVTDTVSPVISGIKAVNPNNDPYFMSIQWMTSEPADSQVEFWPAGGAVIATPVVANYSQAHVINLSSLTPTATYYYRVKSKDAAGNLATSATQTFSNASLVADTDSDGFSDRIESFVGTDPKLACGVNAWPADMDSNGTINIVDVRAVTIRNGATVNSDNYSQRYDLNADGTINQTDAEIVSKYFGTSCSL